jgi:divalent anion:Na+ symporter, DASS family
MVCIKFELTGTDKLKRMNEVQALRFFLKTDEVVRSATSEARARLLAHAQVITLDTETYVFQPGDSAEFSYFLVEGAIYLFSQDGAPPTLVEKGEYFGQEAGVNVTTYATKAFVKEPATLIKMPTHAMERLFLENVPCENLFVSSIYKTLLGKVLSLRDPVLSYEERARKALPFSEFIGWLYALILPFVLFVFLEPSLPDRSSRLFLALLSVALCMWVFEVVSSYIPGIFLMVSVLALGIAPPKVILGGFASETFIAALSIYGLGSVILNSGIIYRNLLTILKYVPENHFWANITTFVMGVFLTPTVPAAVHRSAIMGSVVSDIIFYANLKPGDVGATRLAISAYSGTNLFSAVFLSSSLHNFIILGLLWAQDQERFQWMGWLQAAAMPGLIMVCAYALILSFTGKTDEQIVISRSRIQEQALLLGKKTPQEQMAVVCFLLFTVGVMTSSFHRLSPSAIGLIVLFVLITFNVLSRDNFQRTIDWPSLVLLGGLIGVMAVVDYLGLGTYFIANIEWAGTSLKNDFKMFALVLLGIIFIVRLVVPYGPAVIILATLFMPIAQQYEISPWVVSFVILFWGKMWFFKRQYPPYSTFLDHCTSSDIFNQQAFYRFNLMMNLARILAIFLSIPYWEGMGLV